MRSSMAMAGVVMAGLIVLLGLTGCAVEGEDPVTREAVRVPAQHFAIPHVRPSDLPLPAGLVLPPGAGPFPVVILLHGCNGLSANMTLWASRLAGWGYASLILDSFSPRNVTTVCDPAAQPTVSRFDRAGDALSAALFLQHVHEVDPTRIGVLGVSHGGASAFTLTQRPFQDAEPGLIKAAIDYYGPCRDPGEHGTVPLLALAGEDDSWGFPARACAAFGKQLRPDQPFVVKIYPGVAHAFDYPNQRPRLAVGHKLAYDEAAAADSYERVHDFLDRYLGRTS